MMKGYITDEAMGSANCVRHMMLSCTVGNGFFFKNSESLAMPASATIVLSLSYPWDSIGSEQSQRVGRGMSGFCDYTATHSYMSQRALEMEASSRYRSFQYGD